LYAYLVTICAHSLFLLSGEAVKQFFGIPIPGNVLGMILLLLAMIVNLVKEEHIKKVTDFFLANLAFFFVPLGVSLLNSFDLIKDDWWKIVLIVLITTVLVMVVTGWTVQLLARRKNDE